MTTLHETPETQMVRGLILELVHRCETEGHNVLAVATANLLAAAEFYGTCWGADALPSAFTKILKLEADSAGPVGRA